MSQTLTKEELEEAQGLFSELNSHKMSMGEIELSIMAAEDEKKIIASKVAAASSKIKQKLEELEEKYGKVKINIQDGTLSEIED